MNSASSKQPRTLDLNPGTPLAFVGGFVNASGFVLLAGLFTSHVSGNFVQISNALVVARIGDFSKLLVLPVFVAAVALARVAAAACERRGIAPLQPLLAVEVLCLLAFLLIGEALSTPHWAGSAAMLWAGQCAVAAMGVQNAIGRLVIAQLPATTVMTVNVAQATIDLLDAWGQAPGAAAARSRLRRSAPAIAAFAAGALAGVFGVTAWSYAAAAIPVSVLAWLIWRCFDVRPIRAG